MTMETTSNLAPTPSLTTAGPQPTRARPAVLRSFSLDEARRHDPFRAPEQLAREAKEDASQNLFGIRPAGAGRLLRGQARERRLPRHRLDHARLDLGQAKHLQSYGRRRHGLEDLFSDRAEHGLELLIAVAVTDATTKELVGVDPE